MTSSAAKTPGLRRPRNIIAGVLIVLGLLLAPVAVVASWVRAELVSTEKFVSTFAPLIEQESVQAFLSEQAAGAIENAVDIDALVADTFSMGIEELGLGPRASEAIGLLEMPAAVGIRSLVHTTTDRVVSSQQFADVWAATLKHSHAGVIAILGAESGGTLIITDHGAVSIEIGPIVAEARAALIEQGMSFASAIPEVDRQIPILKSTSLATARVVYQTAVAVGLWLPVLALGLLALGIGLSTRRRRALGWTGVGLAVSFGLLAAGLGTGKLIFVGEVSPALMPKTTAEVAFTHLTSAISSTTTALIVVSVLIAITAWAWGGLRRVWNRR